MGVVIAIFIIALICVGIYFFFFRNKLKKGSTNEDAVDSNIPDDLYERKRFVTKSERHFLDVLLDEYGEDYFIQPQICLMSVIRKNTTGYANELYRTVDLGIFDDDFNVVLLIEINDNSHHRSDRQARDEKVNTICNSAGIPLLTFWEEDNVTDEEFLHDCKKYLK